MLRSLKELSDWIGGVTKGDPDVMISGAADIADAREGDIVFAETPRLLEEAEQSTAAAIISNTDGSAKPMIMVKNPRYAFAQVLEIFSPARNRPSGIHPTATIGAGSSIGDDPSIGFNACVGAGTTIGRGSWIYPFVYIGDNVQIGDNCIIHPFVSIYDDVQLGNGVIVHSGTVIGADGFGYTRVGDEHYKIPQIGCVVIGDNVEIGANVTIDRARTGKTTIGSGTKIDNLVQIAHNVTVGENCIVVAQVGISGSVDIGDRVLLAGQAGLKDHITVGDDAIICGRSGVVGDVEAGEFLSGYPARPHREQMRVYAAQQKLPGLLRVIKDLEKRIQKLESSD
jgi:UDP-3-O-[3-hydroxymyristoyl] glucosamine N-acyltransferase